jgi:hypothetical protein
MLSASDGSTDKVVVYRVGQPIFSYSNDPIPGYADPENILYRLLYELRECSRISRVPGLSPRQYWLRGIRTSSAFREGERSPMTLPRTDKGKHFRSPWLQSRLPECSF